MRAKAFQTSAVVHQIIDKASQGDLECIELFLWCRVPPDRAPDLSPAAEALLIMSGTLESEADYPPETTE
jgi:hypothetical protein